MSLVLVQDWVQRLRLAHILIAYLGYLHLEWRGYWVSKKMSNDYQASPHHRGLEYGH